MTEVIDTVKLVGILEDIVKENGYDHTANCVYSIGNQPVCIAGQVAYKLGGEFALNQLQEGRAITVLEIEDNPIYREEGERHNHAVMVGVGLTDEAIKTLLTAQIVQDDGGTWGAALGRVKEKVGA